MVRVLGVVFAFFSVCFFAFAWRSVARSVVLDCYAQSCADWSAPVLVSIGVSALYVVGGVGSLYLAVKAFSWRKPPPSGTEES